MQIARTPFILAAVALCSAAFAEFTGPAPVAWRWAQPTNAAPGGSIAHIGDTIYAAVGSRVYAVGREGGNQVWRFPVAEPLTASFRTGVVLDGQTVIAAADNGTIFGLDAATGTQKWLYNSPTRVVAAPVLADRYIILPLGDRTIMAIWAEDGRPAWDKPMAMPNGVLGRLTAANNVLYAFDGAFTLNAIDVGSRKVLWSQRFAGIDPDVKPTVVGDIVYICTGDFVVALGARDGRRRWQTSAMTSLVKSPAVTADGIAVLTRSNQLMVFNINGTPVYRKPVDIQGAPLGDPVIVGKQVAVTTTNGSLNMFSLATGARTWDFIVRPMTRTEAASTTSSSGGGATGDGGGGGSSSASRPVTFVQASGNPVSVGDSLLLPARDGSLICFDRTNGLDLTAPEIKMVFPNPGDQYSNLPPVDVVFQIEDDASGLNRDSVLVTVDGQKVDYTLNRDGQLYVRFSSEGKNRLLPDGRKVFRVSAVDWMGNERIRDFVLTLDSTIARPGGGSRDSGGGRRGLGSDGG